MTTHDILRELAARRPAGGLEYGRRVRIWTAPEFGCVDRITVTDIGVIQDTGTQCDEQIAHIIPSECMTLAADDEVPWACPLCGYEALIHVTTADGYDTLWCHECSGWHRKPIAAGVDEHICDRCRVGVSVLERRYDPEEQGRIEVCVYCAEDLDEREVRSQL